MSDRRVCEVVKDLLPLYEDGVLSEETEKLVREHLAACQSCYAMYGEIEKESSGQKEKRRTGQEDAEKSGKIFAAEQEGEQEAAERLCYRNVGRRIRRRRIAVFLGVAGLLLLVCTLSFCVFHRTIVSGSCMEPTVLNGEICMLNRWYYKVAAPERNDIIVYKSDGVFYLSRIVGLPGETVEMKNGIVYVDDAVLEDQRAYPEDKNIPRMQLGEGEYLTIVDNPGEGDAGVCRIEKRDIVGKVWING